MARKLGRMIFNCGDIHRVRVEMAERYSKMPNDEAERDFRERAERARHAIEEIRRAKNGLTPS